MLSKILIMGGNGNMGRRYQAILKSLGVDYIVFDLAENLGVTRYYQTLRAHLYECDGVIIATPTKAHYQNLMEVIGFGASDVAILCEKPFSLNFDEVEACRRAVTSSSVKFQMVNQYRHVDRDRLRWHGEENETIYDYYHSGTDGIFWDCINIIGLDTTGNITLKNDSPVWKCKLNGHYVNRSDVDQSYVAMVKLWLERPITNVDYMVQAHQKTMALIDASRGS